MNYYAHQKELIKKAPKKHLLAWEMGTGKTIAAVGLVNNDNLVAPVLVICPKSIKHQWKEEIVKYADNPGVWRVVTKEEFRRDHKRIPKHNFLVVDEAHYFSGMSSQMSKSLINYITAHKVSHIYLLTATPYMSTPWNIYRLAQFLGVEWGYMRFKTKFFYDIMMGPRRVPVIKNNIQGDVAKLVQSLGSVVKMDDCVDIPEQTFQCEFFNLTSEQRKAIAELEEPNYIARWTKTHQICGGTLKGDGYTGDQFYKSEKRDRLIDICKEHEKVIVVCRYNNEVESLRERVIIHTDRPVITYTGKTKNRHEKIKEAEGSEECVFIVNAACSEGYELPSFPLMVFYSYDFSLKNYLQMIGRIQRINKIKKNVYLSLIVKDTIDHDVYKCIQRKEDFDIAIYGKDKIQNNKDA